MLQSVYILYVCIVSDLCNVKVRLLISLGRDCMANLAHSMSYLNSFNEQKKKVVGKIYFKRDF